MKYFGIIDKNVPAHFNCNERLEIFLTRFCNILCYVGSYSQYETHAIRS